MGGILNSSTKLRTFRNPSKKENIIGMQWLGLDKACHNLTHLINYDITSFLGVENSTVKPQYSKLAHCKDKRTLVPNLAHHCNATKMNSLNAVEGNLISDTER